MAATIYERVLCINDYANDGGELNPSYVRWLLQLFSVGLMTAAQVKTAMYSTGAAQDAQIQAVLDTMPAVLLTILGGVQRSQWADKVASVLSLGQTGLAYTSESAMRTALGT